MLQTFRSFGKYIFWGLAVTFIGGFVFYESSGLFGRESGPTLGTTVVKVDGQDVPYGNYQRALEAAVQSEEQQRGHSLTLDERAEVEKKTYDEIVTEILLEHEYKKRGISVTQEEIVEYAKFSPPPQYAQLPDLQTNGQFDFEKYQRFLRSPQAKAQGLLAQLEGYYRTTIPKQKLFEQVAAGAFVSNARLWQMYRDSHDSAQVSYIAMRPTTANVAEITDAAARTYYDAHKTDFQRPSRAAVSVLSIPMQITAADSIATRDSILKLRAQIVAAGDPKAVFTDFATRFSNDTVSAAKGGDLGKTTAAEFVPPFTAAARALAVGEISQPVKTDFGWHLIRLDAKSGDTLSLRHILLNVTMNEGAAARVSKRADSLATLAASADTPQKFDDAAKKLGLPVMRATAFDGEPLTVAGRYVPNVSAWAFGGASNGESSEMFDDPSGYYVARLDTLHAEGVASFEEVKDQIKERLARAKVVDEFMTLGRAITQSAASAGFESAAQTRALTIAKTPAFARTMQTEGLGGFNEAVGAAFSLPIGAVSQPIKTTDGVFVLRVDRRVAADSAEFVKQREQQRSQVLRGMREQMVRDYLEGLRKSASIVDSRKKLNAAARRQSAA
ncbi:MAG: peptidyl-prolyl cis-trans isomerase [Gemmatimonadaceae bacterium]|nr:peptidyl-prolyl cis-trans isomerase [Gemmatimonadaceae bacterium]